MNQLLRIAVVDTGIGIQEKNMANLTKAFEMIESTKSMNKLGCGLGLNISNKLAFKLSD